LNSFLIKFREKQIEDIEKAEEDARVEEQVKELHPSPSIGTLKKAKKEQLPEQPLEPLRPVSAPVTQKQHMWERIDNLNVELSSSEVRTLK